MILLKQGIFTEIDDIVSSKNRILSFVKKSLPVTCLIIAILTIMNALISFKVSTLAILLPYADIIGISLLFINAFVLYFIMFVFRKATIIYLIYSTNKPNFFFRNKENLIFMILGALLTIATGVIVVLITNALHATKP